MTLYDLERLARAATPGPWAAEELSLTKRDVHGVHAWEIRRRPTSDDVRCVAQICAPGFACDFFPQSEVDANAHLIAALSPERVLALIEVVRAAKAMRIAGPTSKQDRRADFDAALAKLEQV